MSFSGLEQTWLILSGNLSTCPQYFSWFTLDSNLWSILRVHLSGSGPTVIAHILWFQARLLIVEMRPFSHKHVGHNINSMSNMNVETTVYIRWLYHKHTSVFLSWFLHHPLFLSCAGLFAGVPFSAVILTDATSGNDKRYGSPSTFWGAFISQHALCGCYLASAACCGTKQ